MGDMISNKVQKLTAYKSLKLLVREFSKHADQYIKSSFILCTSKS